MTVFLLRRYPHRAIFNTAQGTTCIVSYSPLRGNFSSGSSTVLTMYLRIRTPQSEVKDDDYGMATQILSTAPHGV